MQLFVLTRNIGFNRPENAAPAITDKIEVITEPSMLITIVNDNEADSMNPIERAKTVIKSTSKAGQKIRLLIFSVVLFVLLVRNFKTYR